MKVLVRAPSRLHLGLIAPAGAGGRRYGGAGILLEHPAVEVEVRDARAGEREAAGPLADRALAFADAEIRSAGDEGRGVQITVRSAPPDHVGLGTGTQLGLAVARATAALRGEAPDAAELARRIGRGRRSAVGIWGFERGGFVVDGGKEDTGDEAPDAGVAPLIARAPVPEAWRFVLALPRAERGRFGELETEAFRRLRGGREGLAETLCRLLVLGLLPAVATADIRAFGAALTEYGRRAGEAFREVQGGVQTTAEIARVIDLALSAGAAGAAQSSWGPTAFALAEDEGAASAVAAKLRERLGSGEREIRITPARNERAAVEVEGG